MSVLPLHHTHSQIIRLLRCLKNTPANPNTTKRWSTSALVRAARIKYRILTHAVRCGVVKINPWAITDKGENWLRWEDGQLKRKAKLMHADTTTTCRNILFLLFTQPLNPLTDAARTTSELLRAVDYSASSKEGRRLLTALAKDGLVYQPVPGYWLLTEAGIKQHEQLSVIDRLKTIKEPVVAEDGLQKARRLVDQQYKKPPVSDLDRVVRLERKTAAQRKTLKYYTTRIESLSTALKKCEAEHKEFLNALDMLRAHLAHLGALGALK